MNAEQTEARPMVLFQRDDIFVSSEAIIADLKRTLKHEAPQDHARVAVIGLSGNQPSF
jgi:hypothetical protein